MLEYLLELSKKKNTEYLIACLNSENHIWYDTIFILEFFAEQEFFQFVEKYNFAPENEQKLDILSLELLSDSIN